jgi:proline dehydrogenase
LKKKICGLDLRYFPVFSYFSSFTLKSLCSINALQLVRGAYLLEERALAINTQRPDPIRPTLEDTAQAYNSTVQILLQQLLNGAKMVIVIASHNAESALKASDHMSQIGLPLNDNRVYFAQLQGMCDYLSLTLHERGHNACKLFPFGPVDEVMPYLVRRLVENKGVMGSTKQERDLMWQELQRRIGGKE